MTLILIFCSNTFMQQIISQMGFWWENYEGLNSFFVRDENVFPIEISLLHKILWNEVTV